MHNVQTMIGMLENMHDRLRVQTILNQDNQAQVANVQVAKLSEQIQNALPSDEENDAPMTALSKRQLIPKKKLLNGRRLQEAAATNLQRPTKLMRCSKKRPKSDNNGKVARENPLW